MSNTKKILPFIIIAAIFLVGGYFIGKSGAFGGQDAAIYKAGLTAAKVGSGTTDPCVKSPTNPCPTDGGTLASSGADTNPASVHMAQGTAGCWYIWEGGSGGSFHFALVPGNCPFRVEATLGNATMLNAVKSCPAGYADLGRTTEGSVTIGSHLCYKGATAPGAPSQLKN